MFWISCSWFNKQNWRLVGWIKCILTYLFNFLEHISENTPKSNAHTVIDFNITKIWQHPDRPPMAAFACSTVSWLRVKTQLVGTGQFICFLFAGTGFKNCSTGMPGPSPPTTLWKKERHCCLRRSCRVGRSSFGAYWFPGAVVTHNKAVPAIPWFSFFACRFVSRVIAFIYDVRVRGVVSMFNDTVCSFFVWGSSWASVVPQCCCHSYVGCTVHTDYVYPAFVTLVSDISWLLFLFRFFFPLFHHSFLLLLLLLLSVAY